MGQTLLNAATTAPPAGGAAIGQVIAVTFAAMIVTAGLLYYGIGHRSGRVALLGRIADFSERISGLPGWVAMPSGLAAGALLTAFLGMMWDISIHVDQGRDAGPLANPAHYLILAGLFGVFSAGFFAAVLPKEKPSKSAIRISGDWYAPLGSVVIMACGMFSLIGFPLDDMWHRIFGQDVTLWGPTHLMLIGGASMTLIGIAILLVEGKRSRKPGDRSELQWVNWLRRTALTGGFLIGLSTFQAEFDFGIPQFRMVFGPILVMLAAGVALTATRLWVGRGSAIAAVAFFLLIRGGISVIVGPILGQSTPHFPLFLGEAVVVECVALVIARERTALFGLASGVGIGTLGLASEWAWSNAWMPIHWTGDLLPEGAILGFPTAVAAAMIGAWMGQHLASDSLPRSAALRGGAIASAVALLGIVGYTLHKPAVEGVSARVALTDVQTGPDRTVSATVALDPPTAADGSEFLNVTAWQGDGLIVDSLEPTGKPGTFRTTEPIPVSSDWKAVLRMSRGNTLSSVPIYLPADPAIPAKGVPATSTFTRPMVADHTVLQREQKPAPAGLSAFAYAVVAGIAFGLIALLGWALHRLALAGLAESPSGRQPERTAAGPIASAPGAHA